MSDNRKQVKPEDMLNVIPRLEAEIEALREMVSRETAARQEHIRKVLEGHIKDMHVNCQHE